MSGSNGTNTRLDSWKDIASYLRRDVRTAIRWEKDKGLPVRRVPGGQRKSVFAYTAELDSWLAQETAEPQELKPDSGDMPPVGTAEAAPFPVHADERPRNFLRKRQYLIVAAVLVIALVGLFLMLRSKSGASVSDFPIRVGFTPTSIQVFGENGQVLWTHRFDYRVDDKWEYQGLYLSNLARIADFRGDGEREVLALIPLQVDLNKPIDTRWEADLFSSNGRLLWSYIPEQKFRFGKYELGGPWALMNVLIINNSGKLRIWVTGCHPVWGNSFVVNLDPQTGKDVLRFVNTGVIHILAELKTSSKNYLLVGGFNNEPDTGSLAMIDEDKSFAASPQSSGSRHKCLNCPTGDPDYYFLFPRSEINEITQYHEDSIINIAVRGKDIEVRKLEVPKGRVTYDSGTIYTLQNDDAGLWTALLRFDSGYDISHRQLEKEGKLDHTLENCPERLHPRPVRVWTPAGGWKEIQLEPAAANQ